jgi:diaminopimelate epimerase
MTNDKSFELKGLPFFKMTGSGNDFVVFDGREVSRELVTRPEVVKAICHRRNGIGADGLVVLEPLTGSDQADVRIHYFNSDGSPADLCGNATLCSTALASALGMANAEAMVLETGAGPIRSAVRGQPEIRLQPVRDLHLEMPIERATGEQRVGFVVAGIPHLVVQCDDAESVDVAARGAFLRWHSSTGPAGANVNWVSRWPDGRWRYRTFERGVEGETLACGTGAVATAALLRAWGDTGDPGAPVIIRTSSGRDLEVRFDRGADSQSIEFPLLTGEGRVVFQGQIGTLDL